MHRAMKKRTINVLERKMHSGKPYTYVLYFIKCEKFTYVSSVCWSYGSIIRHRMVIVLSLWYTFML